MLYETSIHELGLTRQREVVLYVIRDSREHMTANEIFVKAKSKLPSISFATVYNSLRFLKEAGHIAELQFGNGASRFDRRMSRHDHAICTECGTLVDIEIEAPEDMVQKAAKDSGFSRTTFEFTLKGLCPECSR